MLATGLLVRSFLLLFSVFFAKINALINTAQSTTGAHRRFEYKYSFKPPYLAQKDGTVPFWEYGGNAIANPERVRVAPSLRSQKGAIWTKLPINFDWWETEIVFRVTGRGRVGADGLAFWYTTQKGDYNGPVFGSSDRWNGLGVFFDSFDNDNKHNNPYISAAINDGTQQFDHQNDASTQILSGCLRDFRNRPFPTRARIEYFNNVLSVYFHNGMTNNNEDYELCLRADGVQLPKNGYFGLSAATGGLADDHDVFHFVTHSLHPPGQVAVETTAPDAEKISKEYKEYQEKLEKQKQEYKRDHPSKVDDEDFDEAYETESQREWRQLWQTQTQIFEHIREVSRKIDEVIGRQESTLSLVSRSLAGPSPAPVVGQQQTVPASGMVGSITRPEIDILMSNQNTLINTARELRTLISDIHGRVDSILQNQQRAPSGQVQAVGYDVQSLITEMRDGMNQVKQGISHVGQKLSTPQPQGSCPTGKCLGVTLFLSVTVVQLLLIFLYTIFKSRSEAQAKKFY